MSKTCWTTSLDSIFLKYYKHLSALWLWIFGAVKSELELQIGNAGSPADRPHNFWRRCAMGHAKTTLRRLSGILTGSNPYFWPKPLSDLRGLQFFENLQ